MKVWFWDPFICSYLVVASLLYMWLLVFCELISPGNFLYCLNFNIYSMFLKDNLTLFLSLVPEDTSNPGPHWTKYHIQGYFILVLVGANQWYFTPKNKMGEFVIGILIRHTFSLPSYYQLPQNQDRQPLLCRKVVIVVTTMLKSFLCFLAG